MSCHCCVLLCPHSTMLCYLLQCPLASTWYSIMPTQCSIVISECPIRLPQHTIVVSHLNFGINYVKCIFANNTQCHIVPCFCPIMPLQYSIVPLKCLTFPALFCIIAMSCYETKMPYCAFIVPCCAFTIFCCVIIVTVVPSRVPILPWQYSLGISQCHSVLPKCYLNIL